MKKKIDSMTQILDDILANNDHGKVTVEEIVDHLNNRGFGPLLAVLGVFVIIVGAIPLVPAVISLIIIFVNIQMLIGKEQPWLPKRIRKIKVDKDKIAHGVRFIKPFAHKIERMLKMRWLFLFSRASEIITALTCIVLAVGIIVIGFIPFLPALLALPIIFFGIGYIAQDGLLIALGFLIIFATLGFLLLQMFPI